MTTVVLSKISPELRAQLQAAGALKITQKTPSKAAQYKQERLGAIAALSVSVLANTLAQKSNSDFKAVALQKTASELDKQLQQGMSAYAPSFMAIHGITDTFKQGHLNALQQCGNGLLSFVKARAYCDESVASIILRDSQTGKTHFKDGKATGQLAAWHRAIDWLDAFNAEKAPKLQESLNRKNGISVATPAKTPKPAKDLEAA